ncbi:hypothetical protein SPHINGOAX6_40422 [Sphingomonas sp. AX6]|nr:hypothetical protein SPHINGOAX6_40422 [Sphingomonas sp. AX6]
MIAGADNAKMLALRINSRLGITERPWFKT